MRFLESYSSYLRRENFNALYICTYDGPRTKKYVFSRVPNSCRDIHDAFATMSSMAKKRGNRGKYRTYLSPSRSVEKWVPKWRRLEPPKRPCDVTGVARLWTGKHDCYIFRENRTTVLNRYSLTFRDILDILGSRYAFDGQKSTRFPENSIAIYPVRDTNNFNELYICTHDGPRAISNISRTYNHNSVAFVKCNWINIGNIN